ncbi:hypothetical protein DERF_014884 [Dermatophagoides farinae]|uniref:Uncharacterized protein n=1 Tax=Dermatophagoides farinae TaxID=6954 RepID=A0A922KTY1_DERFA|nr:hypothetical protein DERF_014884 [Dermatophagoides farinae]
MSLMISSLQQQRQHSSSSSSISSTVVETKSNINLTNGINQRSIINRSKIEAIDDDDDDVIFVERIKKNIPLIILDDDDDIADQESKKTTIKRQKISHQNNILNVNTDLIKPDNQIEVNLNDDDGKQHPVQNSDPFCVRIEFYWKSKF